MEVTNCDLQSGPNGPSISPDGLHRAGRAMLSSILRSPQAIQVNIAIMRTFVQLRHLMDSNLELAQKIDSLEKKYDEQFKIVFEAIKQLVTQEAEAKNRKRRTAGFHP